MSNKDKLSVADTYAARLLMLSFFLPVRLQVFTVFIACVYFVIRTVAAKQLPPKSNYLWAIFLGSGLLLYLLAVLFTPPDYKNVVLHLCERRESLLLMPLAFGIISAPLRTLIRSQLVYFAYVCVIVCAAANATFAYHYFFLNGGGMPLSHVGYRIFFEHFTGIHPTYMGMYLCFSICILLNTTALETRMGRIVKPALIYCALIFLLSLLAKSPLIALVVIFIHYAWVHRREWYRFKALFAGLLASVAAVYFFVPFFRQRMGEMLGLFGSDKVTSASDSSISIRKLIWTMDTGLLKHYWLTGVGPGRILTLLNERYFFFSIANNFNVGYYDPHNQYFYEWISFGLAGIVLFVAVLLAHFSKAIRAKDHLYLYLLIILSVTFFTESVLARQQGVLFYAVFTSLFFFGARSGKDNVIVSLT